MGSESHLGLVINHNQRMVERIDETFAWGSDGGWHGSVPVVVDVPLLSLNDDLED
ncbi:hypothetical protein GCM10009425_28860 [Pseudomonas asuensis]|uniref:Uncharacterized protein n=1 Tax=Pseudomonas asuensis TaxID=1825787 RepID=A0ABQ2GX69_9PSED|nr:hypothetical protein GCM10009425_28860 [Pseudomonas asuensis]